MKIWKRFLVAIWGVFLFWLGIQVELQKQNVKNKRSVAAVLPTFSHKQPQIIKKDQAVILEESEVEIVDDFMKRMTIRMQRRRERVKDACKKLGLWKKKSKKIELIMAERYNLVYCPIPKTGCSNMKRVMLALNGLSNKSEDLFPRIIPKQNFLLHKEVAAKLSVKSVGMPEIVAEQHYIKLIVVRHPFERALSAYKNKLVRLKSGKAQFQERAEHIRKKYGSNRRNKAEGVDPTLEEFVSYLRDTNNMKQSGVDNHWNSYDFVCQPCQNDYDVIAKLETIQEDFRYLMMLIGAPHQLTLPAGYSKSGGSQTNNATIAKFFGSLPKNKVDDLYDVYKIDFLSFGYTIEDVLRRKR